MLTYPRFLLIAFLALSIFRCGGDTSTTNDPPSGGQVVTIAVRDLSFDPKSVQIQPGTTVRWVLRGNMTNHTTTSNNGVWDSGFVFRNDGDAFQHTFTTADNDKTFLYHCETHWVSDEMQGSIRVGNNSPPPPPRY